MYRYKSLYLVFFLLLASGCGTALHSPAPIADSKPAASAQAANRHPPAEVSDAPQSGAAPPTPRVEKSEGVLQALLALGIDYRLGGSSSATGFDCSGLVAHVYQSAFNVHLPRLAKAQAEQGTPVELARIESGDLLFYNTLGEPNSHVGIYIGDGRFVHAPKSGARVRVERLNSTYWMKRFNGARRIDLAAASPAQKKKT